MCLEATYDVPPEALRITPIPATGLFPAACLGEKFLYGAHKPREAEQPLLHRYVRQEQKIDLEKPEEHGARTYLPPCDGRVQTFDAAENASSLQHVLLPTACGVSLNRRRAPLCLRLGFDLMARLWPAEWGQK